MDEKNLKSLYDFAVSNKLDIGDYDSFKKGMEKPENRKSFHEFATANKLDIGTYDEFEKNWSDVKKKALPDPLPHNQVEVVHLQMVKMFLTFWAKQLARLKNIMWAVVRL